jgi:drug/metabolite transporter (DMT)-like permease
MILLLLFGAACVSSSVIFIKLSGVHPVLLAAYRQLLAAVVLLPFFLRELRRSDRPELLPMFGRAALPGVLLGLHFITWIGGARMTLAANATLIISLVPLVMPFFVLAWAGEMVSRREMLGSGVALIGAVVLAYSDLRFTRETIGGDLICFFSMLLYAAYLVMARRNRAGSSLFLYVVPVYTVGGVFCLALSPIWVTPQMPSASELVWIVGIALIPTVLGHSTFNYCMRRMRAQVVSIVGMGEFIFSTIMAFLFLGEIPASLFYPAAAIVVIGALIVVLRPAELEPSGPQ